MDESLSGVEDVPSLALPVDLLPAVGAGGQRDGDPGRPQPQLDRVDAAVEDLDETVAQHPDPGGLHRVHALDGRQVRDEAGQVVDPAPRPAGVDVEQSDDPSVVEVDLPLVMAEALNNLPIPPVRVLVNNRKVVQGVCESLGVTDVEAALRGLDKIDKIGPEGVAKELAESGIDAEQASVLLEMAQIRTADSGEVRERLASLGVGGELLEQGLSELTALLDTANKRMPGAVVADLKIARGLDYYTGSVYESEIEGHEDLGSICSGGRYDSLAKDGKRTYPGVGLSIGVSRLVSRMISAPLARASRKVPTAVVVAVTNEERRERSEEIAAALRARGISTDVAPSAAKFGKQIKFADKRGIPFVWFPGEDGASDTVKDIRTGEQVDADAATWMLPDADAAPSVERVMP